MSGTAYVRLIDRPADAVLFRRADLPITAADLLRHARSLADDLPSGRSVLNFCRDRYAFTVTFLAALLRGQVCLLTGERAPEPLSGLAADHAGCVVVTDDRRLALLPDLSAHRLTLSAEHAPLSGRSDACDGMPVIPADRLAAIVFTSGSTGVPVGHRKLWGALVQRSRAAAVQFGLGEAAPAEIVGTVPPQHMYGFETTVLLPLHAPAASWCGAAFFPEDMRAALRAVPAPRLLITTPLQLRALLRADADLPALAGFVSATAPLEAELAQSAEQRWGAPVLEIFGATEVGSIASRRTLDGDAWRLYPEVRLSDGEITAPHAPPTPLDDEVEMLGDGSFRLLGRRQDIVKLAGHRASIAGLNRILLSLNGVEDGTFLAPPDLDQRATARLLAMVVAPTLTTEAIAEALRARIDPIFLPRRIIRVAALPRNEFGKLRREWLDALLAHADAA